VHLHTAGAKQIRHSVVGRLELLFETMYLSADPELTMIVYTAAPGSASEDALRLLASWTADDAALADRPALP
jgi:hypothetical protein